MSKNLVSNKVSSTPVQLETQKTGSTIKTVTSALLQGLGATIAFLVSMVIASMILPLSPEITAAASAAQGFLPSPLAFLFNGVTNALILIWAARRSSDKGLALVGQLFVLSFGVQVFQTQIETGYFLSAFPLLNNSFELYILIARGLVTSLVFALLVALITGGFTKRARPEAVFQVSAENGLRQGAWLPVVYIALYMLFGYFVAWQVQEVRLFYAGPAELNSFGAQWGASLMSKPELPVFQYFRGILWLLCLIPLFRGFTGKRGELVVLSGLALALLPTAQLAFANPLMPAEVSLAHFWEVSISTGIYGALCAWFVPQPKKIS